MADGWLADGGQFVDSQSILLISVLVNLVGLGLARWDNCHPVWLLRATFSKVADSENSVSSKPTFANGSVYISA